MKTVATLPASTDFRSEVEVIPILTANNFKDIRARFHSYPLPATVAESDFTSEGSNRTASLKGYDKITTADGNLTNWWVDLETLDMELEGSLPCSVLNCSGHTLTDLNEDSWDDINHEILNATLPASDLDGVYETSGEVFLIKEADGLKVGLYVFHEGEIAYDDLDDLIDMFKATVGDLLKFKATAAGIALAAQQAVTEEG
ncbi:MAG: hypothetical protein ACOH1M_04030 [Rhodoglobus sp.]